MNPSDSIDVDDFSLVRVSFASDVDTSDALSISSWSCCISATFSSVKSSIANGERPLATFTNTSLIPISDAVHYFFKILFTRVGYSGTSVSSNM